MKKIATLMGFVLLITLFSTAYASKLSESDVKKLIASIDQAVLNQNANMFSNFLSDDVTITINIIMQGGSQKITYSKQEYISLIEEGWANSRDYKFNRTKLIITISGTSAIVNAEGTESTIMDVQGRDVSMTSESKETLTIKLIDNKLLITNIIGESKFDVEPL